ncbi:Hypothetical protein AA314_06346 [Archangium gephyra]|uniref:Uncharacterized protein n=1 Tax=Archangium gephyra TaxID=48 RepID=A0AAC8QBQ1_9BACT|nr:Hypothetical protein AA314_06346 [Archangium gephyra]
MGPRTSHERRVARKVDGQCSAPEQPPAGLDMYLCPPWPPTAPVATPRIPTPPPPATPVARPCAPAPW